MFSFAQLKNWFSPKPRLEITNSAMPGSFRCPYCGSEWIDAESFSLHFENEDMDKATEAKRNMEVSIGKTLFKSYPNSDETLKNSDYLTPRNGFTRNG